MHTDKEFKKLKTEHCDVDCEGHSDEAQCTSCDRGLFYQRGLSSNVKNSPLYKDLFAKYESVRVQLARYKRGEN